MLRVKNARTRRQIPGIPEPQTTPFRAAYGHLCPGVLTDPAQNRSQKLHLQAPPIIDRQFHVDYTL